MNRTRNGRGAAHRQSGFSLIELLTVIAIIAILVEILLPVLAQVREKARQSICLSNEKQIAMALNTYTQDYDETLPVYSYGGGTSGYFGYFGTDGPRWADLIFPYVKARHVFDCPDAKVSMATYAGGTYFDTQTYSYGYATPSSTALPDANYGVAGRSLARLTSPSTTLMLADSRAATGEGSARILPLSFDTPLSLNHKVDGNRHSGAKGAAVTGKAFLAAYADGHVKYVGLTDTLGDNTPGSPNQWNVAQQ